MLLKFAKSREVNDPNRAHPTDAGLDFFMPEMTDEYIKYFFSIGNNGEHEGLRIEELAGGERFLYIPAQCNALIPSGIRIEIPYGYMGLFLNKSGVASKRSIVIGAQVIDTFYSGEVHIDLHNIGGFTQNFIKGDKLAQMVLVPILETDVTLVEQDDLYDWMLQTKTRGEGGFSSTDAKTVKT